MSTGEGVMVALRLQGVAAAAAAAAAGPDLVDVAHALSFAAAFAAAPSQQAPTYKIPETRH